MMQPGKMAQGGLARRFPRVTDDAGVARELLWDRPFHERVWADDRWHAGVRTVFARLTERYAVRDAKRTGLVSGVIIGLTFGPLHAVVGPAFVALVPVCAIPLGVIVKTLVGRYGRSRMDTRQPVQELLGMGLCGVCVAPLGSARENADGRLCCASCGAAWLSGRVGSVDASLRVASSGVPIGRRWLWVDAVKDARGKTQPVWVMRPDQRTTVGAERGRRITEEVRARSRVFSWHKVFVITLFGAITGWGLMGFSADPTNRFALVAVIVCALIWVVAIAVALRMRKLHEGRVRDAMLAEGLCPCCSDDLSAGEDRDGATACATCGAVWAWSR